MTLQALQLSLIHISEFKEYQKQIVKNAQALCKGLQSRGIKIVSDGTDNHLSLIHI